MERCYYEFAVKKDEKRDMDEGISVALETELTEELILEGLNRELLHQCQLFRKDI